MSELDDIEVYVSGCSEESLLLWIERTTGPIGAPERAGDNASAYPTAATPFVVTAACGDGSWHGIWFRGPSPWFSDRECAQQIVRDLGCVARCDPGGAFPEVAPESDVFLEISSTGERLVSVTD